MLIVKTDVGDTSKVWRWASANACRTHDTGKKLAAVRAAVRHDFPSGNIDSMLGEIEGRYSAGPDS